MLYFQGSAAMAGSLRSSVQAQPSQAVQNAAQLLLEGPPLPSGPDAMSTGPV